MNERRSAPLRARFALALALTFAFISAAAAAQPQNAPAAAPLTLRRALEMALSHSPDVAVARADAEIAGASERIAWSRRGPEAYAGTTPGYATGLPVMVAGQVPSLFSLSVRQSIYDPSLRAGSLGARAEAEERRSAFERVSAETARAVVLAWGRVASDGALLAGARRSLEAQEAIARRASSLAAEGRVTALDADTASLDVARAKQKLLDCTFAKEIDELELKRLLDWPAGQPVVIAEEPAGGLPAPPSSGNLEAARAGDPEIRALDRAIDALRLAAQAQSRLFQPTLLAEAQYLRLASYNHFDDYFRRFKADDFSIALSISVPIWAGGRTRQIAAEARARVERAEAALKVRSRDLELSVRRAEADLARADAALAVSRSAEAVARERARIQGALAAEGRGEPNAAEVADIALTRAEEELAHASQGVLAARVTLLALRGELTSGAVSATRPR